MTLTVSEVLNLAADKIEKPGAWTQKELARSAEGRSVQPGDPKAVCWCLFGAIQSFLSILDPRYSEASSAVYRTIPGAPTVWNDTNGRTQQEAVAALRDAARNAG